MALVDRYPFTKDVARAAYEQDSFNVFALSGVNGVRASADDRIIFDKYSDSTQVAFSYLNQYDTNKSCLPSFGDDNRLVLENFDPNGEHYLWVGIPNTLYAVEIGDDTYVGDQDYCMDTGYTLTDI